MARQTKRYAIATKPENIANSEKIKEFTDEKKLDDAKKDFFEEKKNTKTITISLQNKM